MTAGGSYIIRWKGRQFGPFDREGVIEALKAREISLAHEIYCNSSWMPLGDFLTDVKELELFESARLRADLERSENQRTVASAQIGALEKQIEYLKVGRLLSSQVCPTARRAPPKRELKYATFFKRGCAKCIDIFIMAFAAAIVVAGVGLLMFIFPTFFGVLGSPDFSARTRMGVFVICYAALAPIGYWLYSAGFESSHRQATFGKAAFRLKVCSLDGGQISFATATWRHFASYLSLIPLGIGFVLALATARRQALHDLLAKTVVTMDS